jgi:hypothetical protein
MNNENEANEMLNVLMSSLKTVEEALNTKLPDMDHAINALTSIMTEMEARLTQQDSILSMLLAESPSYNELLKKENPEHASSAANPTSPSNESKKRGQIIF